MAVRESLKRHWRFIGLWVVGTAVAFGVSVWMRGLSMSGVLIGSTVGFTLGVLAVPELFPRAFRFPALWQIGWAVMGSVLVAYQLDAPGEGYALAVVLGGLLGWSSPFWIEHVPLP
jgi:hypothetical protein